jgi:cytochrome-b5 reductase
MLPEQIHHVVDELLAQDKSLERLVPPRPEEPLPQDCCGCSCEPCVFDLYRDDLDKWAKTCLRTLKPDMVDSSWDDGKENLVPQLTDSLEPNEYRPFKITSVTPISKDTNVYRFELRKGTVLSLPVGKHLIMRGTTPAGTSFTRPYTPISPIDQVGSFDIMIKVYEFGKMSAFVKTLAPGASVDLRGPFGQFLYRTNEYSDILMLAAGTGLAPMVQVIQKVLSDDTDMTRIRLLYACHRHDDILLQNRIDEWKRFWNFSVCFFLNKDCKENVHLKYNEEAKFQKIDQEIVAQEFKKINSNNNNYSVLICGTKSFDKDMMNYFLKCGAVAKRLFKF